jgi:P-type conjugative transfer protein TrbJ
MKLRLLAILAAAICFTSYAPPANAQWLVSDPSMLLAQANQYLVLAQQWQTRLQQFQQTITNAQAQLAQAQTNATKIPPGTWTQLESQFQQIAAAPQFITSTTAQQNAILARFQQLYPGYQAGTSFERYNQILAQNSAGAAQAATQAAAQDAASLGQEKVTLDSITQNANATTQEQKLALALVLDRQAIEQMQKLRALTGAEVNSMQAQYSDASATKAAHVQKMCESKVMTVYRQAVQQNPNITIDQVRTAVYADEGVDKFGNPVCLPPAPGT